MLTLLLSSCTETTEPTPPGIGEVEISAGDEQEGVVGEELEGPVEARVRGNDGRPMPGVVVNFRVVSGGGSLFAGSSTTNAEGIARDRWTLGTSTADSQRVEVRVVDNESGEFITVRIRATALPDAPADIDRVAGIGQSGSAGAALGDSLAVVVRDRYGNPVPGAEVLWAVTSGGGAVEPGRRPADASGVSRTAWTLGTRVDEPQHAEARVQGLAPLPFTASMAPGSHARLAIVAGSPQSDTIGARLRTSLVVRAELPDGRPLVGATVQWAPTAGSGSVSPSTSITDAQGLAAAAWTLGTRAGEANLSASSPGLVPATFRATVAPGAPANLGYLGGRDQRAVVGGRLPDSLLVRVVDRGSNPVAGATVAWTAAAGVIQPATATTDADGRASASWILGTTPGAQSAAASLSGGARVPFSATAETGTAHRLAIADGDDQSGVRSKVLPRPLAVRVTDLFGNAVAGVRVHWTVPAGDGSLSSPTTVTDAAGQTSVRWTLGLAAGPATATATAEGVGAVEFSAVATEGTGIGRWAVQRQPGALSVWGSSAENVFAVADTRIHRSTDGATWQTVSSAAVSFAAVWGTSDSDVLAVGYDLLRNRGGIHRYDGSAWREMSVPTRDFLYGVWASSPSNAYAVGGSALLRFDGSAWTQVPGTGATGLRAVWGAAASDVWAVGIGPRGTVLHYDGSAWRNVSLGAVPNLPSGALHLVGVWGTSATDVYVTGYAAADSSATSYPLDELLLHYDGATWRRIPIDLMTGTTSVWGTGPDDLYVAGYTFYEWVVGNTGPDPCYCRFGRMAHWNGSTWSQVSVPTHFEDLWGFGPFDVVAVGRDAIVRTLP